MASSNTLKIVDLCQIAPAFNSLQLPTEFSLPLTFFDLKWFKFPPVERTFFYELTESSPIFFYSVILPKLKQSLSHTLLHFLPLAGRLTWPQDSTKPLILFTPNDTVSLTIAESNSDFNHLSSNEIREAIESRPYIPELGISDTMASTIALQITLFPEKGFCIGITSHHAVLDGKSVVMFLKAWAYMCKHEEKETQPNLLLPQLTPFFNRAVIKDVAGLETVFLQQWLDLTKFDPNPRSLKLLPNMRLLPNLVRATFVLTHEDIKILRERVLFQLNKVPKEELKSSHPFHLSTFVIACAYTLICTVKARGGDSNKNFYFVFPVDARSRLDPPISENYFGNCICGRLLIAEARVFMDKNGFAMIAERISGTIKELEKGLFEGDLEGQMLPKFASLEPGRLIGLAGSTRFGVYSLDFGWGKPKKVEIISIDRNGSISLAESRDGNGGVEVGLVLKSHEMEVFASLFVNGLKDL